MNISNIALALATCVLGVWILLQIPEEIRSGILRVKIGKEMEMGSVPIN